MKQNMTAYRKQGTNWAETYSTDDVNEINRDLARALHEKYIMHVAYIRRITDSTNYDGTRTVTVYYDNGVKNVYVVKL